MAGVWTSRVPSSISAESTRDRVGTVARARVEDAMSTQAGSQGLMLAFSAGVYVYIACTEAAVHAIHNAREFPPAKRLLLFLCFAAGAVGIGLVLLDHEHCAPKDADDSGHGH